MANYRSPYGPSSNRKPNVLCELRRNPIPRLMLKTHTPLALRFNELRHANVLKRRFPLRVADSRLPAILTWCGSLGHREAKTASPQ